MSWPSVKLGECVEIVSGATPSTSVKENWDGNIFWATPKDLSGLNNKNISTTDRQITEKGLNSCSARILPKNSVLFSSRAPIGLVAINTVPMATNQGFKSFITKPNILSEQYLYYWLKKNREDINRMGVGATFKEVSKTIVSKIIIPLPPLAEQQRIAAILDQAEIIKAKRALAIEKLDELAQSVFIEMFGDSVTNNKGWESKSLGEIADFYAGNSLPKEAAYKCQSDGYFLMKVSDMNSLGNEREIKSCKSWSDLAGAKSATCPRGSIVIPKRGGAIGTNKKRITTRPTVLDPNLMAIKPKEEIVLTEYLFQWFLNFDLLSITNGSSVPQLNKKDLDPLRIQIPAIKAQEKFRSFIELHLAHKAKNITLMKKEAMLFDSLQHKAFSGQL